MIKKTMLMLAFSLAVFNVSVSADDADLAKRGEEIYQGPTGCQMCHGKNAEGMHGPELNWGPEPIDIVTALNSVAQMAPVADMLKLTDEDIYALAEYLQKFQVEE